MSSSATSDAETMWAFFRWWYQQNFVLERHERRIRDVLKHKEIELARSRFMEAFVYNALAHTGLALVMWTGFVSKTYSFPLVTHVPYSLRICLSALSPPLLAYLRFQDIFYEKELVALARRWESSTSHKAS